MEEDAAIEQLSAYLDGELTDSEVAELEHRLARDPGLKSELDELRAAVDLLRTHGPVQAPPALYGDILRAVEDEPMPGGLWAWLQRPFGMPLPTVALAAVGLLVVGVTVGGAVVVGNGGLRPAAADMSGLSPYSPDVEGESEKDKVADAEPAKVRQQDPKAPPPETAAAAAGGGDAEDEWEKKRRETDQTLAKLGSGEPSASEESSAMETKVALSLDGATTENTASGTADGISNDATYGTMYSGGPVVTVVLRPNDLERVAALYQKHAGARNKSAAKSANAIASSGYGQHEWVLDLPDDASRNAFEQELSRLFGTRFRSVAAKEDGFTYNAARMKLRIHVSDQAPAAGGNDDVTPVKAMRKADFGTDDMEDAPAPSAEVGK